MPEIKQFPKMHVAYVTAVGPYGETVPASLGKVFAWLGANRIQPMGAPIGIFHDDPAKVPPEQMRCELCVPVASDVQGAGEVQTKDIGGVQVATTMYQGHQNIEPAYNEVYDWLRALGYHDSGSPMETFFTQPPEEIRAEVAVPIVKIEVAPAPKKAPAKRTAKKPVKKAAKKTAKKPAKKAVKKKAAKK
ncbi:MAG: GyrI-like domain-containing protein [Chloroflexi bacterium]|nr:GyrI-like domain-containing protein [Chloroflexota bacterium]